MVNITELFENLKTQSEKQDKTKIVFTLRKIKFRPINELSVEMVANALTLMENKLPITTHTMESMAKEGHAMLEVMHRMGNKKVFTLIRRSKMGTKGNPHNYTICDVFMKAWNGEKIE